jgi:two-component system chemotaxis response regulator CheY
MKILLVDDSAFMRNMIKNILKDGNHEISEAGNYDEAIKAYQEKKPNLVFLDIVMPGKSGVDTLRDIKQIDKSAFVVMCTSIGGQQKVIDDSVAAGANDFIVKPFKPEDILRVVTSASSR